MEGESDATAADLGKASSAKERKQLSAGVEIAASTAEALSDHFLQSFETCRFWEATPRARLGLLQHDESSRSGNPDDLGQKVVGATNRREEKPGVDQVKRIRIESGVKRVPLNHLNIGQAQIPDKIAGRRNLRRIEIESHDSAGGPDPCREGAENPDRTARQI